MTPYTVRFENPDTDTTWFFEITDGPWTDGEAFANYLEDSDALETVVEMIEDCCGEGTVDWTVNDSQTTLTCEELSDDDFEEVITSVRTYFSDLGSDVSDVEKE